MYISEVTIQKVRELPIGEIVSGKVQLKKNMGLSPFTDEKTPSFSISPSKNIFKCFSSGKAGDGITFIMETEKLSFQEAVIKLAKDHHIEIVYENLSPEQEENLKKEQKEKEALRLFLKFATDQFFANNIPETWIKSRKLDPEILNKFQVGYTCETNSFFSVAKKAQYSSEMIQKAGLAKEGKNGFFDTYRDRIIFPIHDYRGNVVAFTARTIKDLSDEEKEARKAAGKYIPPKYINSPETIWHKGDHLYGIHKAQNTITKNAKVYLVEGSTDVLRFHQHGIENVVAPCGTALTKNQIKLIKKFTDTVCIVPDADPAGMKALHRNAELFIKNGLHVSVLIPERGKDPDDQLKHKTSDQTQSWLHEEQDYISEFLLKTSMEKASSSPKEKVEAMTELGRIVELLEDDTTREVYYEQLVEDWEDFEKYKLKKRKKQEELDIGEDNREDFFEYGFYEEDNCYYTHDKGKPRRICTFKMEYLYYIETDHIPLYVIRISNTFGNVHIKAYTADETTLASEFKKVIGRLHGRFVFEGTGMHLDKINLKLRGNVKKAIEPQKLGYNVEYDMYIWANGIVKNNHFYTPDKFGVVSIKNKITSLEAFKSISPESVIEINGKEVALQNPSKAIEQLGTDQLDFLIENNKVFTLTFFFLPFANKSKIDTSKKNYKDHKRFEYVPNQEINFHKWSTLMMEVHKENAYILIGYYLMSLNHDIIFGKNSTYIPLLNLWGTPNNGKSTAARSLSRMFGIEHNGHNGMNLSNSTLSGMMEFANKFKNAIIWFDELSRELKNDKGKTEMLKGIADGTERKIRRGGNYNYSNEKNENGTMISGQDSASFDTGLNDRVLVLKFDGSTKGTDEKLAELNEYENKGFTTQITVDLLGYRAEIKKNYLNSFKELSQRLSADLDEEIRKGTIPNIKESRVIKNAISVLAPMKILMDAGLEFPFEFEQAYQNILSNTLQKISIKAVADEVSQFFEVIMGAQDIQPGIHYKIQKEKDGVTKLFLRLRAIMPYYRQACIRQQKHPFNESDLKEMLLSHRACKNGENTPEGYKLGLRTKNVEFIEANIKGTSAIVLNYEILRDLDIEMRWGNYVEDLTAHDDPGLIVPPHLNGKAKEMVYDFILKTLMPNRGYEIKQLWVIFNMDKTPPMPEDKFRESVSKYCQEANGMEGKFTYRIAEGKIYLEEKQGLI